jgi:uncharacterized protein (DUF1015 family)
LAVVRPFDAIRPRADIAGRVAALPYDVYNRDEALAEVVREPMSFLQIDRAEIQFPPQVGSDDDIVYAKARDTLWQMVQDGIFIREGKSCYYIYELTMNGRAQTGLVGCASIDDYLNNVIKKHENTREDKELDRINHVDICNAQTGPIFLAYHAHRAIGEIVNQVKKAAPLYDFTSPDDIRHAVWCIDADADIAAIAAAFAEIENIYIADGHHRAASAVKVGLKRRAAHPDYNGEEEFNYFLSVLFPHDQLLIMDYNRVVKDLNGYGKEDFLLEAARFFDIEEMGKDPYKPRAKAEIGMYLDGQWYKLMAKDAIFSHDPVKGLDVSLLQDNLLKPILGIKDPRTDKRIDFVGGIRGLEELERRANSDMQLAFAMYPTQIEELFAVSDADKLMPPKSTWFEPKLRSGLFIHELD